MRGKPSASSSCAVVFGVAERDIGALDVRRQLPPSSKALLDEIAVHADEVVRGRDVVVHERHASRERVRRSRGAGADGEVMDEDILRRDRADHLAVVDRAVLERGGRPFRRRSPIRIRRCAAHAARRGPRGRSRRRSPAWRAPDGRAGGHSCGSVPAGVGFRHHGTGREAGRRRPSRAEYPVGGVRTSRATVRAPARRARDRVAGTCPGTSSRSPATCSGAQNTLDHSRPRRACSGPFDSSEYSVSANSS